MTVTLDRIEAAAASLAGHIVETPFRVSRTFSDIFGAEVRLKLENLQFTASFKERGAWIRLLDLDEAERRAGVVAVSAGNHAQGVAHVASQLKIPATIVMPISTPVVKIRNTERLGARVVVHGANLSEAEQFALDMAARDGLTLIHPYDDERIIAGQGTIGLEMLREAPDLDALIVPVGGGGLISGIATAAKAVRPDIEVIGVEAALFPSMHHAIHGLAAPPDAPTIAEGIAVKRPGNLTRPIVERLVDEILLVTEAQLERAVQMVLEIEKTVAEGAGAAPIAALLSEGGRFAGKRLGLVVSGGNIDSRLLASVLMRGLVGEGRLVRLRMEVSDQPGSLARITRCIADLGGDILEVYHQRWFYDVPIKLTEIDVVVETRDAAHMQALIAGLNEAGIPTRALSSTAHEVPE